MCYCVTRGLQLYHAFPKINLYVSIMSGNPIQTILLKRLRTTTIIPFLPFSLLFFFFFFFFLLVNIFGKLDPPPPDENSWIRACFESQLSALYLSPLKPLKEKGRANIISPSTGSGVCKRSL